MAGLSAVISYLVAFFYTSKFIASKVYDEENSNLPEMTIPVLTLGTLVGSCKPILSLYNKSYDLGVHVAEEFIQDSFEVDFIQFKDAVFRKERIEQQLVSINQCLRLVEMRLNFNNLLLNDLSQEEPELFEYLREFAN